MRICVQWKGRFLWTKTTGSHRPTEWCPTVHVHNICFRFLAEINRLIDCTTIKFGFYTRKQIKRGFLWLSKVLQINKNSFCLKSFASTQHLFLPNIFGNHLIHSDFKTHVNIPSHVNLFISLQKLCINSVLKEQLTSRLQNLRFVFGGNLLIRLKAHRRSFSISHIVELAVLNFHVLTD